MADTQRTGRQTKQFDMGRIHQIFLDGLIGERKQQILQEVQQSKEAKALQQKNLSKKARKAQLQALTEKRYAGDQKLQRLLTGAGDLWSDPTIAKRFAKVAPTLGLVDAYGVPKNLADCEKDHDADTQALRVLDDHYDEIMRLLTEDTDSLAEQMIAFLRISLCYVPPQPELEIKARDCIERSGKVEETTFEAFYLRALEAHCAALSEPIAFVFRKSGDHPCLTSVWIAHRLHMSCLYPGFTHLSGNKAKALQDALVNVDTKVNEALKPSLQDALLGQNPVVFHPMLRMYLQKRKEQINEATRKQLVTLLLCSALYRDRYDRILGEQSSEEELYRLGYVSTENLDTWQDMLSKVRADHEIASILDGSIQSDPVVQEQIRRLMPVADFCVRYDLPTTVDYMEEMLQSGRYAEDCKLEKRLPELIAYMETDAYEDIFRRAVHTLDTKIPQEKLASKFQASLPFRERKIGFVDAWLKEKRRHLMRILECDKNLDNYVYRSLRSIKRRFVPLLSPDHPADISIFISPHALDLIESLSQRLMQSIQEKYDDAYVLKLLSQNPTYAEWIALRAEEMQAQSEHRRVMDAIHQTLVSKIPEKYQDLYPLARSIQRKFIIHAGPTNSGKTYEGIQALKSVERGLYLAPLRLLAFEQYEILNAQGIPCSLITGEEEKRVEGSRVQSSTVEMLDLTKFYQVAVVDEAQMIADRDRGGAWTKAILGLYAAEIHVCCTFAAVPLLKRLISDCGDTFEIHEHVRKTPLVIESSAFVFPKDVQKGDALIVFSRRNVHAVAAEVQKSRRCSIIYGALPYDVRHEQARRFAEGETDVVVSTDAIGMGMNLPIRRVVFLETEKYDGVLRRELVAEEIKQIAGRAGRFGIYPKGYVSSLGNRKAVARAFSSSDTEIPKAIIDFPESLLGIDGKLSQILSEWIRIAPREGFDLSQTAHMKSLAECVEGLSDDKMLAYQLVTIPFDAKSEELFSMWRELCKDVIAQELPPAWAIVQRTGMVQEHLDDLELQYKELDLAYNFVRRFGQGEEHEESIAYIDEQKDMASTQIMKLLKKSRFAGRKCSRCGKKIPWNYPYGICQDCYESQSWDRFGNDRFDRYDAWWW